MSKVNVTRPGSVLSAVCAYGVTAVYRHSLDGAIICWSPGKRPYAVSVDIDDRPPYMSLNRRRTSLRAVAGPRVRNATTAAPSLPVLPQSPE